jgi:hypothetical protein
MAAHKPQTKSRGAVMIEFAIVAIIMFSFIFGIFYFAIRFFYTQATIEALDSGARKAIVEGNVSLPDLILNAKQNAEEVLRNTYGISDGIVSLPGASVCFDPVVGRCALNMTSQFQVVCPFFCQLWDFKTWFGIETKIFIEDPCFMTRPDACQAAIDEGVICDVPGS